MSFRRPTSSSISTHTSPTVLAISRALAQGAAPDGLHEIEQDMSAVQDGDGQEVEHPDREADVGHHVQEWARALRGDDARDVEDTDDGAEIIEARSRVTMRRIASQSSAIFPVV